MLVMLLLLILYSFDIHNLIRAKFKTETATQSAALAGAKWQQNSLNMIGNINIIKACETLMSNDDIWGDGSLDKTAENYYEELLKKLQYRLDLLSEMQTRISFIGPIIGFAAAQQAAKLNGLSAIGNSGQDYLRLLGVDNRYNADYGGAPETINNFRWKDSYSALLRNIVNAGIAVYPNARLANSPNVVPAILTDENLYTAIEQHLMEIKSGSPPKHQSSWKDELYSLVKNKTDSDYNGKWWNIDYSLNAFPGESEIFTIGVQNHASNYNDNETDENSDLWEELQKAAETFASDTKAWNPAVKGLNANFFFFDNTWYPQYYDAKSINYHTDHYQYWFENEVLRDPVKDKYRYEGCASYAEGAVEVGRTVHHSFRSNFRNHDNSFLKRNKHMDSVSTIGSKRNYNDSTYSGNISDYRPGSIAKVFGELENDNAPIKIPVILPAFNHVAITPTFMPIPAGFGVLRPDNSLLNQFLSWLAGENSLTGTPPNNTNNYLEALQKLADGKNFRYYGWNENFDKNSFNQKWKNNLTEWDDKRLEYIYSSEQDTGPGWLQEPQRFYGNKSNKAGDCEQTTDYINGGTATRYFVSDGYYYVVSSKGEIVTNDDSNPTISYNRGYSGGSSGNNWNTGKYDTSKGPGRL